MTRQAFATLKLPDAAGVYFFMSKDKRPLYIGKATSLRSRVRSYFAGDIAEKRSPWIEKMVQETRAVRFKKTASVLEAILLEAECIRKWKPPYNTKEKDDKSGNCIVITDEEFPRVLVVRSREALRKIRGQNSLSGHAVERLASATARARGIFQQKNIRALGGVPRERVLPHQLIFGPFPNGTHLRAALKIVRKIFPFRDSCTPFIKTQLQHTNKPENVGMSRGCFNRQLGLCPGVCTGEMGAKEYQKHIARLAFFLSGKTNTAMRGIEREMQSVAKRQAFERAGELKRQLFALRHIQDVALIKNPPPSLPPSPHPLCVSPLSRGRSPEGTEGKEGLVVEGVGGGFKNVFRIEAYDLSHFGGKNIVGAMAVVWNGVAHSEEYRLFKIRNTKIQNEVAGLQEMLERRLHHRAWPLPQLIVVDGNAIQKRAAARTLAARGKTIPVVAVVKDARHHPRTLLGFYEHSHILQNMRMSARDAEKAILLANSEAHRFALRFQKKSRRFF